MSWLASPAPAAAFSCAAALALTMLACDPKPAPKVEGATAGSTSGTASSGSSGSSASPASCKDLTVAAKAKVVSQIEQSRACTADAECATIAVATRCFDMCTRTIAVSRKSAVQAALADADTSCADFLAAGCHAVIPPCLPPPNATCVQGKCTQ